VRGARRLCSCPTDYLTNRMRVAAQSAAHLSSTLHPQPCFLVAKKKTESKSSDAELNLTLLRSMLLQRRFEERCA